MTVTLPRSLVAELLRVLDACASQCAHAPEKTRAPLLAPRARRLIAAIEREVANDPE